MNIFCEDEILTNCCISWCIKRDFDKFYLTKIITDILLTDRQIPGYYISQSKTKI